MRSCGRIPVRLVNNLVRPCAIRSAVWSVRTEVQPFRPAHPFFAVRTYSTTPKPEEEKTNAEQPSETQEQADKTEDKTEETVTEEEKATPPEEELSYEELLAANAKLEEDAKTLKNQLAYALADIDNVRKISRKDVSNAREFALKGFGKDLLDVVDNCERALEIFPAEAKEKGHPMAGIYTGLEMTAKVLIKAFEKHGLTRIEAVPKETIFDPNFHDALFQQPVEGLDAGVVFAVVKTGWTLNGRVLRAAQVGVSADAE